MIKLSSLSVHWLREIAAGRDRLFANLDMPYGWRKLETAGLAKRIEGTDRCELTPKGVAWLAANPSK